MTVGGHLHSGGPAALAEVTEPGCGAGWDDTIVVDRSTGQYIDPARVRRTDHNGQHFTVAGPLNIGRAP